MEELTALEQIDSDIIFSEENFKIEGLIQPKEPNWDSDSSKSESINHDVSPRIQINALHKDRMASFLADRNPNITSDTIDRANSPGSIDSPSETNRKPQSSTINNFDDFVDGKRKCLTSELEESRKQIRSIKNRFASSAGRVLVV